MKREALRHPKTYDLAARLGVRKRDVLGILTLLWDFTADAAPSGDIGKWSNGAIARACDWDDDPDTFVDALVSAGWLDEDEDHRLIVHDWPDHAQNWVRAKLRKANLEFLPCYFTGDSSPLEKPLKSTLEPSPPRDQTKPNQTKPNQDPPNPPRGEPSAELFREDLERQPAFGDRPAKRAKQETVPPAEVQAAWNEHVGTPRCDAMTEKRKRALRDRARDPTWRKCWLDALRSIRGKPFLCGSNDRGWRATLDWFLRPDSVTKILEGFYDNGKASESLADRLDRI